MQTLEASLDSLVAHGVVDYEEALSLSQFPKEIRNPARSRRAAAEPSPASAERCRRRSLHARRGRGPCPAGWLVQPARLLGVTIIAEEPFVLPTLADVIDYRPTFATIVLDVPIGSPTSRSAATAPATATRGDALRLADGDLRASVCRAGRACTPDRSRRRWSPSPGSPARLSPLPLRSEEADEELQPYHQRRIFSASPELSFLLVNADDRRPRSRTGRTVPSSGCA
jgi:hypothetical protein